MKKRKKRVKFFGLKDKYARRRTCLVLFIVLFVLFLKLLISSAISQKEVKHISLLLDNEIIKTQKEIFFEKGTAYLSKEDIEEILDKNLYYNEAEKELITTYNKHIAELRVDENYMIVNDSNVELQAPMIEKNSTVYLPFSEMGIVYDLEFEYSKSTGRVIADSVSKAKSEGTTLKKVKLKKGSGILSRKLEKINKGDKVVIIEETGKLYKVRSAKGNIGYVKQNKITDIQKIRDSWEEEAVNANILENASNISKKYSDAELDSSRTNVVIPKFFYIEQGDEGVTILDKTNTKSSDYKKYMTWVEENGIEVWATVSNNSEVSESLRTYAERNKIINDLYYKLVEYQFRGINIDFEKIDDVNSFNRFIIELTPRLKELGLKVSVKSNPNIDVEKIRDVVDIIID